jgi:multiple sugar transport system substrate-binding protein
MRRFLIAGAAFAILAAGLTGCGGDRAAGGAGEQARARGPIRIWYSDNREEVVWGRQMVEAWNAAHPAEKVTAQEIPAGRSSEERITAAITAGNAPCLIFNTAPAAVPQYQKQGGLVALSDFPDGANYIESRGGDVAPQYRSSNGKYYQLPWKANPIMIFYNRKVFQKAGLDADAPPLSTYREFLETARKLVSTKSAQAAIWPSPTSEFHQSWFDFYPLFAAETGGRQLVVEGRAQFTSPEAARVLEFWRTLYAENLAPAETYNGDAFADGRSAMAVVGPWAIAVYQDKVDWGAVAVPTSAGSEPGRTWTFSDSKNVAMYSSCRNRGTAWEVLKFATSQGQDGMFLEMTGQMPLRRGLPSVYPDYFADNPAYQDFADQAGRTVEVPNVPNSIKIWQTFRDAYTKSVIFGKADVGQAFGNAAAEVDKLANQG